MIKQVFQVEHYWEVIVFYSLDYDLFDVVEKDLLNNGASQDVLEEIYYMMYYGKAKAATYNNFHLHTSVVLFNRHKSKEDYLNSIVHEAEHIKQAMLKAYKVEDEGEPPAYTIGYLVMKMWSVFKNIVCQSCDINP